MIIPGDDQTWNQQLIFDRCGICLASDSVNEWQRFQWNCCQHWNCDCFCAKQVNRKSISIQTVWKSQSIERFPCMIVGNRLRDDHPKITLSEVKLLCHNQNVLECNSFPGWPRKRVQRQISAHKENIFYLRHFHVMFNIYII